MTKSAFAAPERSNWRYGTDGFALGGTYGMENGLESRFSIQVGAEGKRLVRDDKPCPRLSDHIGLLPVVMISPSDISLVSDSSDERRRFANAVLSQMDPEYLAAVQAYNRLLAQRNHMLRQENPEEQLLSVFDHKMSSAAQTVYQGRLRLCEGLRPLIQDYYAQISGGGEEVSLSYKSDLSGGSLPQILSAARQRDLALHYTTCGVQRDDFLFTMNGHPIRRAGSQGQQKSFLVALKFAQYEMMKKAYGFPPLLLLDDVFDKLDLKRISHLIELVAGSDFGQIFISDTDKGPDYGRPGLFQRLGRRVHQSGAVMSDAVPTVRLHRKQALSMEEVVSQYIKSMKIAAGLNTQRIFEAWDVCSGAAPFTLKRYYRGGKLYITLNSSVIRNQLYFQKDALVEKINAFLREDKLFTADNRTAGFVQELILK